MTAGGIRVGRRFLVLAVVLVVTTAIAFVAVVAPAGARRSVVEARTEKPLTLSPMWARFIPTQFSTRYKLTWRNATGEVHEIWRLNLELVDRAGAADPGEFGSKAAVDLGCDNAGIGVGNHPFYPNSDVTDSGFLWHHPDAAESQPPGRYHCNHLDMGPHGHQGLITVVVEDDNWKCTASYKGTNSTSTNPLAPADKSPSAADMERSVKNGTASTPKCSPRH